MSSLGNQPVVLAAKKDDTWAGATPDQSRNPVGLQPRADDDTIEPKRVAQRPNDDIRGLVDRANGKVAADNGACLQDLVCERASDRAEVDDGRGRRVKREAPFSVRLDLAEGLAHQQPQPRYVIGRCTFIDGAKPDRLVVVQCNDEFSALLEGKFVLGAEVL